MTKHLAILLITTLFSAPPTSVAFPEANGLTNRNMIERAKQSSEKLTIDQLIAIAKGIFSTPNISYKELGKYKGYTYYAFETVDLPYMSCIIRDDGAVFDTSTYKGKKGDLAKLKPYIQD
ncbi:MAG: hypothetical protein ATN34_01520 [Epulopiscium sp. Nele67-Bin002]|nr:MAG: hypothetical protein ATN34_01520 [Epulopiscium sp. Nele67-Bin002]